MNGIQYFLEFDTAIERLKNEKETLRWKIHYAHQLVETSHYIMVKRYDVEMKRLYEEGLNHTSLKTKVKFLTFNKMFKGYMKNMRAFETWYSSIRILEAALQAFKEAASKEESDALAERYEADDSLQKIVLGLIIGVNINLDYNVHFDRIVTLIREYYSDTPILFTEEQ